MRLHKENDQLFKSATDDDPRGMLDLLDLLPLDQEAELEPIDRELVRDPIVIDQGFIVRQPGGRKWIAHIEAFSRMSDADWDKARAMIKAQNDKDRAGRTA